MTETSYLFKELEKKMQILATHAWDDELRWPQIVAWLNNFRGEVFSVDEEKLYGIFLLSRFIYFSRKMTREMLKSLYRDMFCSPLCQRIRRNIGGNRDGALVKKLYEQELQSTRFIGMGNPSESGAHLLYYFRQINGLKKDLFVDFMSAFVIETDRRSGSITIRPTDPAATRYIFFDDLVGSGTQVAQYLARYLPVLRRNNQDIDIQFMSLFATKHGLQKLNSEQMFGGKACCLFELDETYKAFIEESRYFSGAPVWFNQQKMRRLAEYYGNALAPGTPLGFQDGQLLLGFSHNTPDNSPPIFWREGYDIVWTPVFIRYDKHY